MSKYEQTKSELKIFNDYINNLFGKKYKTLYAYRKRHPHDNSYNAVYLFDTLLDDKYTWQRVPGLDQKIEK